MSLKGEMYRRWAAEAAADSERQMQAGKIAIWLERAPDDAETFTKEHQAALDGAVDALRKNGVELEAPFLAVDAADAVSGYTGQLIISLASFASSIVTAALVAWLKGRPGRKIRVQFHPDGKLKTVEAQTPEQVLSIVEALEKEARAKSTKAKPK
jgi:Asp-tRNA(Asn)/Glu-tRNA(Gln) amidotransferase A subunit family amidase